MEKIEGTSDGERREEKRRKHNSRASLAEVSKKEEIEENEVKW